MAPLCVQGILLSDGKFSLMSGRCCQPDIAVPFLDEKARTTVLFKPVYTALGKENLICHSASSKIYLLPVREFHTLPC